jgi:hypothetical protein
MASQFYFTNSAAGFTPSGFNGTWGLTASTVTQALGSAKAGAAATVTTTKTSATNPTNVCWGRWVSGPATQTGTLSGTVSWVVGVKESATTANAFLRIHIYVLVGATNTVRGTLLSNFTDTVEFGTAAAGQTHMVTSVATDLAVSSVSVTAGDLVVVEIGWQGQSTLTTTTATMNYGNTGTFDLLHGGDPTLFPGWVLFSDPNQVLLNLTPYGHNLCRNPAAGVDTTAWDWPAGLTVTSAAETGFSRSTGVHAVITATGSLFISSPTYPAAAGETWTMSVEMACSASRAGTVFLRFKDSNGATLAGNPSQAVTFSPTVQRVVLTGTAPANTAYTYITCNSSAWAVSDTVDVSCAMYDQASGLPVYADGNSGGWVWDGTTNKSSSHEVLGVPLLAWRTPGPNYRR